MRSYYLPFAVTICGSLLYHLSQRSIPKGVNPFLATIIAYLVGIGLCAACVLLYPAERPLRATLGELNWAVFAVGVAVVLIELGFLLAYRAGWRLSVAAVATNVAVSVILLPVGLFVFKDQLSFRNVLGLLFCVVGLLLVAKR
ncbi:MAG TPA: hypothetical protein VF546_12035 [Pyrinomonadaceae bacterium]|jgi:uncharacterized membrane protein